MMKLFDNIHLISDGDQFILKEVRTVKKMIFGTKETTDEDVEKENVLGYFSTLTAAMNHAVNYSIREQLAKAQEKVKQAIESMTGLTVTDVDIKVAGVNVQGR